MINVAIEATKAAGELAYRYFKTQLKVSYKPDDSPVTRADIEAEKLIRKIVAKKFPDHGIIGEELPPVNPKARFQWIIDPIDGTRYFARGFPFWGTLLTVLEDNQPIIGIAFCPALDDLFIAEHKKGTYLNGKKQKVSKITNIKQAYLANGGINYFNRINKLKALVKLYEESAGRIGIGGIYGYSLLTTGRIDIVLDPKSEIYDVAAPALIVEEAGGKFSDFKGKFT